MKNETFVGIGLLLLSLPVAWLAWDGIKPIWDRAHNVSLLVALLSLCVFTVAFMVSFRFTLSAWKKYKLEMDSTRAKTITKTK
jgi:hypothetical protein